MQTIISPIDELSELALCNLVASYKKVFPTVSIKYTHTFEYLHSLLDISSLTYNKWILSEDPLTNIIVGFCAYGEFKNDNIFLFNLGIHPKYRKKGYGTQLMKIFLE